MIAGNGKRLVDMGGLGEEVVIDRTVEGAVHEADLSVLVVDARILTSDVGLWDMDIGGWEADMGVLDGVTREGHRELLVLVGNGLVDIVGMHLIGSLTGPL